ncbi:zinc ABC transporter ATP-binding protein AztA [Pseudonocardia nigra]|uniref:zinc ABC transporter ATP-binding protein AztA n=1 Tax=Pseudonocardia nigra TaxID=1921578 RepID=UPI0027E36B57|nr:zinc ABC transporter ATP-binding protein AztA [Pseudonocardia nigra]
MDDEPSGLGIRDLVAGHGRRTVLHGITARIPRGRVTAVVGPNGAGKSTLLDVIAGVLAPSGGTIDRRAGRPAYVVQRSAVPDTLPITVRAAVEMGRWSRLGPWRRLTTHDRAVVEDCMARLGIRELAGYRLGEVSGGQRQRALVAQGLAQESGLLLLDEPSAGLDTEARQRIDAALDHAAGIGVTVLRVTHDAAVAERAHHCLLLRGGRLVANGPRVIAPPAVTSP